MVKKSAGYSSGETVPIPRPEGVVELLQQYRAEKGFTMRKRLFSFILASLCLVTPASVAFSATPAAASTTYKFAMDAEVNSGMVSTYGSLSAIRTDINNQLAFINAHFSGSGLTASYDFYLQSISTYSGVDARTEAFSVSHPGALLVVYTENTADNGLGGWYGDAEAIVNYWPQATYGGDFSSNGNYGMTHECGHFRGAIDEYNESVPAANNPVSGTSFQAPTGIMNYPYGTNTWSAYSADIINASGGQFAQSTPIVDQAFPKMRVNVKSQTGANVAGATVSLYPVQWNTNTVQASANMTGTTNNYGNLNFRSNPFQPGISNYPWNLYAPNFLVEAAKSGHIGYGWLPLTRVGAYYYSHPGKEFTLVVKFTS